MNPQLLKRTLLIVCVAAVCTLCKVRREERSSTLDDASATPTRSPAAGECAVGSDILTKTEFRDQICKHCTQVYDKSVENVTLCCGASPLPESNDVGTKGPNQKRCDEATTVSEKRQDEATEACQMPTTYSCTEYQHVRLNCNLGRTKNGLMTSKCQPPAKPRKRPSRPRAAAPSAP